ncbi:MAG TPA: helix-turn-helix domain-containing protein [Candidatus Dormibacteraeota bacterium]|nr:helix-turn-helix domain-containing protein [Candidatus Dormibacteraeota bacterium]
MADRIPSTASAWLSLGEASRLLGITPATLRRWADQGDVAAFVTPGGHRRFKRSVIESLVPGSRSTRQAGVAFGASVSRVARAYSRAKPAGRPPERARSQLSETARAEFKDRGHRLLGMLLDYLDSRRSPARLATARAAAADYGRRAEELGVSLSDTVEAFVRFRRAFTGELAVIARRRHLETREATTMLVDAERAVDQLLVALMNGHAGVGR